MKFLKKMLLVGLLPGYLICQAQNVQNKEDVPLDLGYRVLPMGDYNGSAYTNGGRYETKQRLYPRCQTRKENSRLSRLYYVENHVARFYLFGYCSYFARFCSNMRSQRRVLTILRWNLSPHFGRCGIGYLATD